MYIDWPAPAPAAPHHAMVPRSGGAAVVDPVWNLTSRACMHACIIWKGRESGGKGCHREPPEVSNPPQESSWKQ